MDIGKNIKRLREERKLTQEQVAEELGVSFQAVSSWERDEYKPDTDNLIKLAEMLDVSVSALIEEKHKAFKTKETIYNWEHMKTYVKTTAKNYKLNSYVWADQPKGYGLEEKVDWLKKNGFWGEVRKRYLEKKNGNMNHEKKSRALYAETIHEIYQKANNKIL